MKFFNRYILYIELILLLFASTLYSQEIYKIGVVCPITNSSKTFGIGHLQGVTLAINEFNKKNNNFKLEIEIYDDNSSPSKSIETITELMKDKSIAVLGPCNSSVAMHLINNQNLQIPIVSSLTTNSKLIENSTNEFFFRANVPDSMRMSSMLEKIFRGSTDIPDKLTFFYEKDDAYGEGLRKDTIEWFNENNEHFYSRYVSFKGYSRDAEEQEINLLIDDEIAGGYLKDTHGALILGLASDAKNIIKEIRKRGKGVNLYFFEPNHMVFQSLASEGIDIGGLRVLSVWDPENKYLDSFITSFINEYAEEPVFAASVSYDATNILLWAIDRVLETEEQSLENIRRAIMNKLKEYGKNENIETILTGNLELETNEYKSLRFAGLQYYSDGTIGRWNDEPKDLKINITKQSLSLELPNYIHISVLIFFGFIGGFFREFQLSDQKNLLGMKKSLLKAEVLIDGLISLVSGSFLLILVLLMNPMFLTSGANIHMVYIYSAIAIGAFSGFLGIRSIQTLLKRFDIKVIEPD